MKKTTLNIIIKVTLLVSVLLNAVLVGVYFAKIKPETEKLKGEIQKVTTQQNKPNCTNVFIKTEGNFGTMKCLTKDEIRAKALEDCTNVFRSKLDSQAFSNIGTVEKFEQIRQTSMTMCMEGKGLEY